MLKSEEIKLYFGVAPDNVLCLSTSDETFNPFYTMGAGECKSWRISDGEKLFNSEQVDFVQRYESYLVVTI